MSKRINSQSSLSTRIVCTTTLDLAELFYLYNSTRHKFVIRLIDYNHHISSKLYTLTYHNDGFLFLTELDNNGQLTDNRLIFIKPHRYFDFGWLWVYHKYGNRSFDLSDIKYGTRLITVEVHEIKSMEVGYDVQIN